MKDLDDIRFHYFVLDEEIREDYPKLLQYSYPIHQYTDLSEIEMNVYDLVKSYNLPLLREYPVKRFFLDLADPIKKIAIEIDGDRYHQDVQKDTERQKLIEQEGWKFYRIKGKHTYLSFEEFYKRKTNIDLNELSEYEDSTSNVESFIQENIELNADCLLLYLRSKYYLKHFQQSAAGDEDNIRTGEEIAKSMHHLLERRRIKTNEWPTYKAIHYQ